MQIVDFFKVVACKSQLFSLLLIFGLAFGLLVGCDKKVANNIDDQRIIALGQIMAERTTALCGDKGRIVLLVNKNKQDFQSRVFDIFCQGLSKSVKIVATEKIDLPSASLPGLEPFSPDKFSEVLQKYSATADYLVSFVGVPSLNDAQIKRLPSPRPQVVVVVAHSLPTPAMFRQKVVCLAAMPKMISEQAIADINSGRKSTKELFDSLYQSITPENVQTGR